MSEPCKHERDGSGYTRADAINSLVAAVLATADVMAERDEARAERDALIANTKRLEAVLDGVVKEARNLRRASVRVHALCDAGIDLESADLVRAALRSTP